MVIAMAADALGALRLAGRSGKVGIAFLQREITSCCAGHMPKEIPEASPITVSVQDLPLPFSANPAGSVDLTHGVADPAWGSKVEHSSFGRMEVETAAVKYAYAYIVSLPVTSGHAIIEIDLQVSKGRIGLSVLGKTLAEMDLVVWVDEHESTKVLFLPVENMEETAGLLFRNGTLDGTPSKVILMSARLLRV